MTHLRAIAPTGTKTARGFACRADGTCINEWQEPTYPWSRDGEQLRQVRVDCGIGLRAASRALGISAAELSSLEAGRAVFADDAEWPKAFAALRAAKEQQ